MFFGSTRFFRIRAIFAMMLAVFLTNGLKQCLSQSEEQVPQNVRSPDNHSTDLEEETDEPPQKPEGKKRKFRVRPFKWISAIVTYPVNRVMDFFDCFRANVAVGPGIGVNLRCTPVLRVGAAIYDSMRVGFQRRKFPVYHETSIEAGVSLIYIQLGDADRQPWEIGATLHLILVGADVGFDLQEFGDFLAGWVFLDPLEDGFKIF